MRWRREVKTFIQASKWQVQILSLDQFTLEVGEALEQNSKNFLRGLRV